jgi:hypothetical protein
MLESSNNVRFYRANKSLLFKNITTRGCTKKRDQEKRSGKFLPAFATEFRTRPFLIAGVFYYRIPVSIEISSLTVSPD